MKTLLDKRICEMKSNIHLMRNELKKMKEINIKQKVYIDKLCKISGMSVQSNK